MGYTDDARPPDYDVGCSVKPLANPPKSNSLKIDLDRNDKKKTYNRGDAITGRVTFAPSHNVDFDRILVDLQATETVMRDDVYGDSSMVKSISIARHRVQSQAYPEKNIFKRGFEYTFTFSLVVPHLLSDEHCPSKLPLHYQLPPSIGCPVENMNNLSNSPAASQVEGGEVGDRSMSYSYRVRARITKPMASGGKIPVINQSVKYVRVMASYPAIQMEPKTYTKNSQLKHGLLKRLTKSEFNISTEQVPTFHINDEQEITASFNLVYRAPLQGGQFRPPPIKQLVYKLNAITTSANTARRYYPRADDLFVHRAKDSFETQWTVVTEQPRWKIVSKDSNQLECHGQIEAKLTLPVEKRDKIVPSFFSCLSSRQYELSFMLELGCGYSSICFDLPAVIARDKRLNLLGMTHDSDEVMDPVPQYESYSPEEYIKLESGRDYERKQKKFEQSNAPLSAASSASSSAASTSASSASASASSSSCAVQSSSMSVGYHHVPKLMA